MLSSFQSSDSWVILSPIEASIKAKIESIGTPLKDWNLSINYGIKTGLNEAFIISTEKRDEILSNCKDEDERRRTAELIRPILRGRDIKRYSYDWAGLWLVSTFPARKYDIDSFPSVKKYLLSYASQYLLDNHKYKLHSNHLEEFCYKKLSQSGMFVEIDGNIVCDKAGIEEKSRKKTNNKWFEVQDSVGYWDDFNKPIIAWQRITQKNQFCITTPGICVLDSMAFISNVVGKETILLSVLNSNLMFFLMKTKVHEYGSTGFRLSNQYVELMPVVKKIPEPILKELSQLLREPTDENKINDIVYKLYGITKQEQTYIEQCIARN